jgi:hypothetical protein
MTDEITYIYCSCDFLRYRSYIFNPNVYFLKDSIFDEICSIEPSRGMIAIMAFYNYYNNVSITGFTGKGHAMNSVADNAHNITTTERSAVKTILSKKINIVNFSI